MFVISLRVKLNTDSWSIHVSNWKTSCLMSSNLSQVHKYVSQSSIIETTRNCNYYKLQIINQSRICLTYYKEKEWSVYFVPLRKSELCEFFEDQYKVLRVMSMGKLP
ncbi:hypothetical protein CARUB_v10024378mg [Capsella rubella]|uniref:Uncharacterized protein n=1 Tax=Capsella rubella TaxID=81985 RepID=R0FYQ5_9BRAS|nr:hypothetical protein CARUB_v10024378mg [Capsella rubella]